MWNLRLAPEHKTGGFIQLPFISVKAAVRDYPAAARALSAELNAELARLDKPKADQLSLFGSEQVSEKSPEIP